MCIATASGSSRRSITLVASVGMLANTLVGMIDNIATNILLITLLVCRGAADMRSTVVFFALFAVGAELVLVMLHTGKCRHVKGSNHTHASAFDDSVVRSVTIKVDKASSLDGNTRRVSIVKVGVIIGFERKKTNTSRYTHAVDVLVRMPRRGGGNLRHWHNHVLVTRSGQGSGEILDFLGKSVKEESFALEAATTSFLHGFLKDREFIFEENSRDRDRVVISRNYTGTVQGKESTEKPHDDDLLINKRYERQV